MRCQPPLELLSPLDKPMLRLRQITMIGAFIPQSNELTEGGTGTQERLDTLAALHPKLQEVMVNAAGILVRGN